MGAGLTIAGKPATTRSWGLLGGTTGMLSRGSTPERLALLAAAVPLARPPYHVTLEDSRGFKAEHPKP